MIGIEKQRMFFIYRMKKHPLFFVKTLSDKWFLNNFNRIAPLQAIMVIPLLLYLIGHTFDVPGIQFKEQAFGCQLFILPL